MRGLLCKSETHGPNSIVIWLWIHVLSALTKQAIKPAPISRIPKDRCYFSSAKTIFFGTILITETPECICKLKLNAAEGKLRLRRGGWHERDRSLIFMQGKTRQGKAGSRWRSRDFRNIFSSFRDSPLNWWWFWFANEGPKTFIRII